MGAGRCGADVVRSAVKHPSADLTKRRPVGNESLVPASESQVTWKELSTHDTESDCWVAVKDKVYDVTEFAKVHPGGKVIYHYAGRDATDVFLTFHHPLTHKMLPKFLVGNLVTQFSPDGTNQNATSDVVRDFRALRVQMQREKMFEPSFAFYTYKVVATLAILGVSALLLAWVNREIRYDAIAYFKGLFSNSSRSAFEGAVESGNRAWAWSVIGVSGILLGLFWQQCGWLAHDFEHHQVFRARYLNTLFGGYFLGNFLQGFSNQWWKNKHNTHHAAPNECDEKYEAVDPDIDTLPYLAWSEDILKTVQNQGVRAVLRVQHRLLLPVLLFARFAWLHASLSYAFSSEIPKANRLIERVTVVLHYVAFLSLALFLLPPALALSWFLTGQLAGGLFLGFVFVQSHNGMEVYNDDKDFYTAQIVSTRDVKQSWFNDWFSGGLNRQIEHHLFPTMPRHHLRRASVLVKALCEKHSLVYEDVSFMEGTKRVLTRLREVAAKA